MKKWFLLAGAVAAFIIGYGASASFAAYPSGGVNGRAEHRGYFTNALDDEGGPVLRRVYDGESIRPDVNDADSFITFIKNTKLDIDGNGSGDARDKAGAAFIIHSMLGNSASYRYRPPTAGQIADWEARIRYLDSHNKIAWRTSYSFTINSYYQGESPGSDPNDDAYYDESATADSIVFRNINNTVVFAIKWYCGNPVGTGNLGPLPDNPDYNMWGGTTVSDSSPAPGDTITFRHYLENIGSDATSPDSITWRIFNGPTVRFNGNSGTFAAGQRKDNVQVENYVVPVGTAPGTKICRNISWTPNTQTGGTQAGTEVCATVAYDFTLQPIVNISVNGAAPTGGTAEAGDNITFTYLVKNSGSTTSQSVACNTYSIVKDGSYSAPTPIDSASNPGPYTPPALGCPRTFAPGTTTTLNADTFNNVTGNKTYCISFIVNPATYGGSSVGVEQCIKVVAKPYLKVFGGDILAGSGLETAPDTCTNNTDAQILSWNRRTDDNYAGAGAQYAAMALNRIGDFASAQRAGSSAAAPADLSFASTTANPATGNFGGSFGSAPCIKDYWGAKPTTALAGSTTLSSLATGSYALTGNQTFNGGNINPGQRTVLYVNGNVRITGSGISYPGSWTAGSTPQFLLVVNGNIYIDPSVTTLYGNYVAQGNGTTGGVIYTCATSFTPPALDGSLYNTCKTNKLTVNGSFTANRVEFLRTKGSVKQSTSGDVMGNGNIGEEFVYSPLNWMAQPPTTGNTANYDAITSLPPIL